MSQQQQILEYLSDGEWTREIPITQGKVVIVDTEDFERLNSKKWFYGARRYALRMKPASGKKRGVIYMHREVLDYKGKKVVDHINGNPLDNRKSNLRIVTNRQNVFNQVRLNKRNTSGFRGVQYIRSGQRQKRWMAQIGYKGKNLFLGYYLTKEEACEAWKKKEQEILCHA